MVSNIDEANASLESTTGHTFLGVMKAWKRLTECRWLYFTLALTGFFAMGHFAGASQKEKSLLKAQSISAEKYELRRTDGKVGARLAQDRRGATRLTFFDQRGLSRLEVGLTEQGAPSIMLLGEDERPKIGLAVDAVKGDPQLFLCDDSGDHVISLAASKGLGPNMTIGRVRRGGVSVGVLPDGSASVDLTDTSNQARISLSVDEETAGISFADKDHRLRACLRVLKDGSPAFSLYDRNQRERLIVHTDKDGKPSIRLIDPDRNSEKVLTID
jgi:hypothetical protein